MTDVRESHYFRLALAIVLVLAAARIAVIALSGLNLYPDEAQYWFWSLTPDFGYFSKPPLLAWVIRLTTSVCGQEEFCIRISSPLLHAATSLAVFFLGKLLYDARTGFWAAIIHATLPAVFYSANLISTDVPLLFFWALAMIGLWRLIETPDWGWALLTGVALGLGFMSKYAMSYFLIGAALFMVFDARARARAVSLQMISVVLVAAAIFAPNVWWNLSHDFATVSHTAANANWTARSLFNPGKLLKFLGDQFAVFGPILFAALLVWLVTVRTRLKASPAARQDLYLLCFTLPPLLVVAGQAFISRANANWAVTAYVAATVLITAWLLRMERRNLLKLSVGLHAAFGALVWFVVLAPQTGQSALGLDTRPIREMTGWDIAAERVSQTLRESETPYTAIVINNRFVHASLAYYLRREDVPLKAWDNDGVPSDHFEMAVPFRKSDDGKVLLVSRKGQTPQFLDRFEHVRFIDAMVLDVGQGRTRTLRLYELSGLKEDGETNPDQIAQP
jgi:4-amino-4-deoxy-L-arabinose transferase-like glycosyltransferase